MFKPVPKKASFPEMEKDILQWWDGEDIFRRSLEQRRTSEPYVFYDGPPFATGLPHYGHLLACAIKDIVPRYQTMRGYRVERRFGWDCHGLPIEALAQEALGLSGAAAIREHGVDKFNEQCRSMVLEYVDQWRQTVTRLGRWVDFDNDYKTMDLGFMETIWWVFKQLWDRGRIYKAHRIMPYSWKLNTPLSNFEAGRNYQLVSDPSVTVRVRLRQAPPLSAAEEPCYALLWTTTPWTLPSNLAICAAPGIEYLAVRDRESKAVYLLAAGRMDAVFRPDEDVEIIKRFSGRELEGWTYEPLFPWFADHPGAFRFLVDDFVTLDEGTGLVHMAPAYGEDDYRVCSREGIELVDPLDDNGVFTDSVPDFAGRFCRDADRDIIRSLKQRGSLVHQATIEHSYPFCDRTDTPLIYRAIEAWYVRIEDLRERLVCLNENIKWLPESVGHKRFGNWLREARDWNISRNRFWGSCIPVWVADDGSDSICMGSIEELERWSGVRLDDLHKHVVDKITFEKDGITYRRTPEVLDCWFESGSMPYAQQHYPFGEKRDLDEFFPADFIAEGLDQTRGWFYTLLVLSAALFDRPAYRNVIVNGLILAEDGRKMSKRLQNYPDPVRIIDTYGADALRLYMMNSPVVRAEKLCFTEEGVRHSLRHLLLPWWNAYSFFVTYARVDNWTPSDVDSSVLESGNSPETVLDRWILSCLDRLAGEVGAAMDEYDLQRAVRPFVSFIGDLTNWYIRRSRRRFWKSTDDADKQSAYSTLYAVLLELSRIAAPFVPFISEMIYRNLRRGDMPVSVHLCDFPRAGGRLRDPDLEESMAAIIRVVSCGRQLRAEHNVKIRQPLRRIEVICRDGHLRSEMERQSELIAEELNVREVLFHSAEGELVELRAKPNFRLLGPRLGSRVKKAAAAIARLPRGDLERLLEGESVELLLDEETVSLSPQDVLVERHPREGYAVSAAGELVVALDTALDDDLVQEGLAREIINKIQQMRKTAQLEVTDRICISCAGDPELRSTMEAYRSTISRETLALDICWDPELDGESWDINGRACRLAIRSVSPDTVDI